MNRGGVGDDDPPLYLVRRNVIAMMAARDYIVEEQDKTREEYVRDFCYAPPHDPTQILVNRDRLTLSLVHKVTRVPIRVFFLDGGKFGKSQLQRLLDRMGDVVMRAVIVIPDTSPPTPPAKKMMDEMNRGSDAVFMQWFLESELSTNIVAVNRSERTYRVLLDHEKDDVLKRYDPNMRHFPYIWYSDPVARYYGLQRNQILKCFRSSETAGGYTTYKICRYTEEVPRDSGQTKKHKPV
jgi:DNA-directed RNA polymerase I, II, and III subunit RPABC1